VTERRPPSALEYTVVVALVILVAIALLVIVVA